MEIRHKITFTPYLLVSMIILSTQPVIGESISEKLSIPLAAHRNSAPPLYPSTLREIIKSKTGVTVSEIMRVYNVTSSFEEVLTNRTFQQLLSCFPRLDVLKSIDHNIEVLVQSWSLLPPSFIERKVALLKENGLENILNKSSIDTSSVLRLNGLEFCQQLHNLVAENYDRLIFKTEAKSWNQTSADFIGIFKKFGISNATLENLIVAFYSNDMFNVDLYRSSMKTEMLLKLSVTPNDSEMNSSFYNFLEIRYNISQDIVNKLFVKYLGFSAKMSNVLRSVKIKELGSTLFPFSSLLTTIGSLPQIEIKLSSIGNQPLILTAFYGNVLGLQNVVSKKLDELILKTTGVSEEFTKTYFGAKFTKHFSLINGSSLKELIKTHFKNKITVNSIVLMTFKDVVENLDNFYPEKMRTLIDLSRSGLKYVISEARINALMLVYNLNVQNPDLERQTVNGLLSKYITGGDKSLMDVIQFKAVTRYFFREFTLPDVISKTQYPGRNNLLPIGGYAKVIESRYGPAVRNALLEMQFFQVLPIFCNIKPNEFRKMKIGDITKQCADLDLNNDDDMIVKGLSKDDLKAFANHSVETVLHQFQAMNVSMDVPRVINLRQLSAIVTEPKRIFFELPLTHFINESEFIADQNITLEALLKKNTQYDYEFISSAIKSGYNIADLKNHTMFSISNQTGIPIPTLFTYLETSLHHVIELYKYLDDRNYIAFLDLQILEAMCDVVNGTLEEIGERCKVLGSNPYVSITNIAKIVKYTVNEIKQVARIGFTPNTRNDMSTRDLFSYAVEGFAGLRRIQYKVNVPLIILSKQYNVPLQQLKEQPLTQTFMNMLQIDYLVLQKLFSSINETILSTVQGTPFSKIPELEDGLDNVQQLYTGSIDIIAQAIQSQVSGGFAVNQHLPKFVKMIAKMKFVELYQLYEVTEEDILDAAKFKDLVAIGYNFFGIHTDSLFQASFDLTPSQYLRLKDRNVADIYDIYKHKMMKKGMLELKYISLTDLVKFIADYEQSYSDDILDFLLTPISDLAAEINLLAPSSIREIIEKGNSSINFTVALDLLTKISVNIIPKNAYNVTSNQVASYVFVTALNQTFLDLGITKMELMQLNVKNLLQKSLKYLIFKKFLNTPWKQLVLTRDEKLETFVSIIKNQFNRVNLPSSFDHIKMLKQSQFVFNNMTFAEFSNAYDLSTEEGDAKSIKEILVKATIDFTQLYQAIKNTTIIQLMTVNNISRADISIATIAELSKQTLKFGTKQLLYTPFFRENQNESIANEISRRTFSTLNTLKSSKSEMLDIPATIWVTYNFADVINFFFGNIELQEMMEKRNDVIQLLLDYPLVKLIKMFSIDQSIVLDSSVLDFMTKTFGVAEDDLITGISKEEQNVLKHLKIRDIALLKENGNRMKILEFSSWNTLKEAAKMEMLQVYASTLKDKNVSLPLNEPFIDVLGRLLGEDKVDNHSILLQFVLEIANNSTNGMVQQTKLDRLKNILTRNFTGYLTAMRKNEEMYHDIPLIEIIQMMLKDVDLCDRDIEYCGKQDFGSMCAENDGMYGKTCICKTGFLFNRTECSNINECEENIHFCDVNAICTDVHGGHVCECKEGFSGNGTVCGDACSGTPCPSNSICVNVDTGANCVCNKTTDLYNKEKNICESGKAAQKLKGMKFNLTYNPLFQNKLSKVYTKMARKMEKALFAFLQKRNKDVTGVRVTDMKQGSIVVDAVVIFSKQQDKNEQDKLKDYLISGDKTELNDLNPAADFSAVVSDTNECTDGNNPCKENESCERTGASTHTCYCKDGYELKDNNCKKKEEESSSNVVKIVVPIVVVLLLLFIFYAGYSCIKKKRNKTKFSNNGYGQAVENPTYDNKE